MAPRARLGYRGRDKKKDTLVPIKNLKLPFSWKIRQHSLWVLILSYFQFREESLRLMQILSHQSRALARESSDTCANKISNPIRSYTLGAIESQPYLAECIKSIDSGHFRRIQGCQMTVKSIFRDFKKLRNASVPCDVDFIPKVGKIPQKGYNG